MLHGSLAKNLRVSLGRDIIRSLVMQRANDETRKLSDILRSQILSVKFDGVTRLRSHYLDISVQYWSDTEHALVIKF